MTNDGPVKHERIVGNDAWRNYLLVPTDGPTIAALGGAIDDYLSGRSLGAGLDG